MASLVNDTNGRKRIQFRAEGKRKTLRLGKCSRRQAESIKFRVEQLVLAANGAMGVIEADTLQWLKGLDGGLYDKLAAVGLVEKRTNATLDAFIEEYLKSRTDLKPNSQLVYSHTRRTLREFFGADKPLRSISERDAQAWRAYLVESKLSPATVGKRTANAKAFFNVAVKRKLIPENPFADLDSKSVANKARQYFVAREEAEKVLEHCPDAQWRLLFALARYGGLRTPSEPLELTWDDIAWDSARMTVRSPKTEHHEGRESRVIPIFPEVRPYLEEVFELAEPGIPYVITRYRDANANLRTQLLRILKRAGLQPWPRLFQNLRASRETELAAEYPLHVATTWIGNTARIAERHYLQVPDEAFAKAIRDNHRLEQAAQNAAHVTHAAQNPAQQSHAKRRNVAHVTSSGGVEKGDLQPDTADCSDLQDTLMEAEAHEHPPLALSKTLIAEGGGAKCGAVDARKVLQITANHPELGSLIEAWPDLSDEDRAAILEICAGRRHSRNGTL